MSLVISYLIIGLITAAGRLLEQAGDEEWPWDAIGTLEWLLTLLVVVPITVVAWPYGMAVRAHS